METETSTTGLAAPRRMAGLTITCDHCPAIAVWRTETKAADHPGADVHWTCEAHK